MVLVATNTFDIDDQTAVSASSTVTIQPPATVGGTGRGRIIHPTLGTYDYAHTPDETVGLDGDLVTGPIWAHASSLGGAVDAQWPGYLRDGRVIERWLVGDTGGLLAQLRMFYSFFANPPSDPIATPVIWVPNYATANQYQVAIVGVRAGGEGYTVNWRLARSGAGYAPQPVEIELRVFDYYP